MKIGRIQRLVQAFSAFLINSAPDFLKTGEVYNGPEKKLCLPVLNCHACPSARTTCPMGLIQNNIAHREIPKFWPPIYALGILGLFMALFGRAACGWLCPFGLFQDLLGKIRKKKSTLPKWAGYGKYVVLIFLGLLIPYFFEAPWFCRFCPDAFIMAALPWLGLGKYPVPLSQLGTLFFVKAGIFVVVVGASIFVSRFFCRTMCPLGAILGLFNRWSFMHIEVDDGCTKCGACKKLCPVDHSIMEDAGSADCIRCMRCTQCKHVGIKFGFVPDEKKEEDKIVTGTTDK